jgi:hypothetical protein
LLLAISSSVFDTGFSFSTGTVNKKA